MIKVTEEKREKETRSLAWSVLILGMALLTLVSALVLCLYGLYGLSDINHNMKMEQLNAEKDIALINNNDVQYIDYNKLELIINKINLDCGSTFITKEYGSNIWSTFHALEDDSYLELDQCFEGLTLN